MAETSHKQTPQEKWKAANPLASWAHSATRSAVRRGLLTPQPCEVCGSGKVDAHHPDHRNPLRVAWLCRLHHRQHHAAERKAGGAA